MKKHFWILTGFVVTFIVVVLANLCVKKIGRQSYGEHVMLNYPDVICNGDSMIIGNLSPGTLKITFVADDSDEAILLLTRDTCGVVETYVQHLKFIDLVDSTKVFFEGKQVASWPHEHLQHCNTVWHTDANQRMYTSVQECSTETHAVFGGTFYEDIPDDGLSLAEPINISISDYVIPQDSILTMTDTELENLLRVLELSKFNSLPRSFIDRFAKKYIHPRFLNPD